ncbi:hypothetical protein DB2_71 [Octadecabacter Antarctic DB virus 2]|nr:hypothetical protein DB2_71 [Octadecabacter Antarctic DB virus 2]
MNVWIVVYLGINILGLGIILASHGQDKTGKHSVWEACFGWSLSLACLYMAGVFSLT